MTAQLPSTEYTLEDLREIAYRGSYDDMQRNLARALLAAHEQEPVKWQDAVERFREYNIGFPVEKFKADYVISWVLANYPRTAPVPAVPECFERLLAHAQGIAMGVDWNKGTAATHHRDKLCQAVKDCAAMLNGDKS